MKNFRTKLIQLSKHSITKFIIGFTYIVLFSATAQAETWLPYPTRVCEGEPFTQISGAGAKRTRNGTKAAYCRCTDGFAPKRENICAGKIFTSSCKTSAWSHYQQIDFGTSRGKTWTPNPLTIAKGTTFRQTSECGATRTAVGTKAPVVKVVAPDLSVELPDPFITKIRDIIIAAASCSDLKEDRKNIIYFDDLGPFPNQNTKNGGSDPNGLQDMVIVLALANKHKDRINLLGVGTSNRGAEDYRILKDIVKKAGLGIRVWSEDQIRNRIATYAKCPLITTSNRLAVAIGGEWNKLGRVIGENPSIRNKIESAGLSAYNVRDCGGALNNRGDCPVYDYPSANQTGFIGKPYYDGNPYLGWLDSDWGHTHTFNNPLFREPYLTGSGYSVSQLDDLYGKYISKGLQGIRDNRGKLIHGSRASDKLYEHHITPQNPAGSRLKIADFLGVARFIWPNHINQIHKKSFIHPKIKAAIDETY